MKPTAAAAQFPYNHRSLEQVDAAEAAGMERAKQWRLDSNRKQRERRKAGG